MDENEAKEIVDAIEKLIYAKKMRAVDPGWGSAAVLDDARKELVGALIRATRSAPA